MLALFIWKGDGRFDPGKSAPDSQVGRMDGLQMLFVREGQDHRQYISIFRMKGAPLVTTIAEALVGGLQVPVRVHEVKIDAMNAPKLEAGKREPDGHGSAAMLRSHHKFGGHADVLREPGSGPPHFIEIDVLAEIRLSANVCPQGSDDLPTVQRD